MFCAAIAMVGQQYWLITGVGVIVKLANVDEHAPGQFPSSAVAEPKAALRRLTHRFVDSCNLP